MKVTGDSPKVVKEPQADITATLIDFAITMEGNLTAGKFMKVQHHGAQPHFLEIEKGPDSMTKEQVTSTFMGMMSGTPGGRTPGFGPSAGLLQPDPIDRHRDLAEYRPDRWHIPRGLLLPDRRDGPASCLQRHGRRLQGQRITSNPLTPHGPRRVRASWTNTTASGRPEAVFVPVDCSPGLLADQDRLVVLPRIHQGAGSSRVVDHRSGSMTGSR